MAKKPPYPTYKLKKRPAIIQSKAPSLVPVLLAYLGLCVAIAALYLFHVASENVAKMGFGSISIVAIVFAAVYQVHFKFRHPLVRLVVGAALPIWVGGSLLILYWGVFFPAPIETKTLTREDRTATVNLDKGSYRLYAHGYFPTSQAPAEESKPAESGSTTTTTVPPKSFDMKGRFVVTLNSATSSERSQTFSGLLESSRLKRRVAKRGRAFVEYEATQKIFAFRVKESGPQVIELKNLDPALDNRLLVEVLPGRSGHWPIAILGFFITVALSFIDYLIREAREYSFFGPACAATFSYVVYFRALAMPDSRLETLVMTAFVGALIGVACGMLIEFILRKPFYNLNRKWRYDLH